MTARCRNMLSPHEALYNGYIRWSRLSTLDCMLVNLAAEGPMPECIMIYSTPLKAHRAAAPAFWGSFQLYRPRERRAEIQAPCRV
jgi:hypothetical protein